MIIDLCAICMYYSNDSRDNRQNLEMRHVSPVTNSELYYLIKLSCIIYVQFLK